MKEGKLRIENGEIEAEICMEDLLRMITQTVTERNHLRAQVTQLQRANNDEMEKRREAEKKFNVALCELADIQKGRR